MGDETRGQQESPMGVPSRSILNAQLRCLDFVLLRWEATDCAQIVMWSVFPFRTLTAWALYLKPGESS